MSTKERLIHYLKPMRKSLIFAFVFALLFVASQLAQPFLLGRSLDASKDNAENIFNIYLIVALVLAVLGTVFDYLFEVIVMNVSQRVIKNVRDDIYNKINSISIKDFDKKAHGDMVQWLICGFQNPYPRNIHYHYYYSNDVNGELDFSLRSNYPNSS